GWDRSVTIVNAVDTREFHPGVPRAPFRQELGVPDVSPLVGLVGRIGLGKGHEHFVDAAVRLLRGGTNAHFAIVGDPLFDEDAWRADALRRAVKDAGLEDRIRFVGYRRDVPEVMRGLDVLVLASDAEPCGRVLFEAMASGTAVVATSSGGTPEIVRDGLEGVLVPPRDPAALARAGGASERWGSGGHVGAPSKNRRDDRRRLLEHARAPRALPGRARGCRRGPARGDDRRRQRLDRRLAADGRREVSARAPDPEPRQR